MITCPKCQKQLEDGTKFCDSCGTQIVETIFCPNCGNPTSTENAFCQVCGASLAAEPVTEPAAEPAAEFAAEPTLAAKLPVKLSKKMLAVGAAALAAVVLIGVILAIALSGGKNNYMLYLKDKDLFYSEISKIKPMQVTEELIDSNDVNNAILNRNADTVSYDVTLTKDGKTLFYFDKYELSADGDVGSGTLYCRSATNAKKEPVKIDSDIYGYTISENGKLVTYKKNGNLYQHNLKDKKKIAGDVASWTVSEDGKVFFWTDEDGDLYMKKGNKDKKKLDSEVYSITMINEKANAIWYEKNYDDETGTFDFFKHDLKDKKKLASDVSSIYAIKDSGEFYYTKSETEEKAYYDFVENDTSEADEYLVESLKENKTNVTTSTLFYYDGKGSKELSKNANVYDYDFEKNILIYAEKEDVKVKLSTIKSTYDVQNAIYDADRTYFVALEAATSQIDADDVYTASISPEGDAIYYVADVAEPKEGEEDYVPTGTVYKLAISGKKVKKAEKYADDVYAGSLVVYEDGAVQYRKDYKAAVREEDKYTPASYELYINNKKVADDVNGVIDYDSDNGTLLFYTEYNNDADKKCYTLNYWNGKKVTKVSDDVYTAIYTPEGEVLYLKDYNTEKYKGELFLFSGKKSKKVDEDVIAIVPVYVQE